LELGIEQIYNDILTEHIRNNYNKKHLDNPTHTLKGVNPSCGDEITLELIAEDGLIKDASFTGIGCAISQASTSIMIDLIRGKSIDEALALGNAFFEMIKGERKTEEELEILEDAIALKDISHMPARVKCAVLSWHTLKEVNKELK
jgi:nitrogen fixation NifU-like protein